MRPQGRPHGDGHGAPADGMPASPIGGPMIELRNLCKRFGSRCVADGLHLEVRRGECVALLGPSGSGKSTLLRLVAGLEGADAGEIRLGGRPVGSEQAPHRRGIGFLFQSAALWPHLSVAGNVAFGLEDRPAAWRCDRVAALLERVGLAGLAARAPATLSGGEARRVALARALAAQRPILLLDEPTAALDAELRERMLALIDDERAAHGLTVLMATHEARDAARLADRQLALHQGALVEATP